MEPTKTISSIVHTHPYLFQSSLSDEQLAKIYSTLNYSPDDEGTPPPSPNFQDLWKTKTDLISSSDLDSQAVETLFAKIYTLAFPEEEASILQHNHDLVVQLHRFPKALKEAKGDLSAITDEEKNKVLQHPDCVLDLDLQKTPSIQQEHLLKLFQTFRSIEELNLSQNPYFDWNKVLPNIAKLKHLAHLNLANCDIKDFSSLKGSNITHLTLDQSAKQHLDENIVSSLFDNELSVKYID